MAVLSCEELSELNEKLKQFAPSQSTRKRELLMPLAKQEAECEEVYRVPIDADFRYMQGGGTDGKYLYYALVTIEKDGKQTGRLVKMVPKTGEVVKIGPELEIDHSNDITYNPRLGQLIVVHNAPRHKVISFVDPETLEEVGTKELSRPIFCMAYNEKRDCYVVGDSGAQNFSILDADFNFVRQFRALNTRNTTQGMTCDDDHLYFVQYYGNCIMQYDWEGNFEAYIPLSERYYEPENISIVDGEIYIAFNTYGPVEFYAPLVMRAHIVPRQRALLYRDDHPAFQEKTLGFKGDRGLTERFMLRYSDREGACRLIGHMGPVDTCRDLQGGGTDGTYLYQNLVVPGDNGTRIVKYDPKTGEMLQYSEVLELNHSNDLTYNPHTNQLIVVHNVPCCRKISFVDRDTLELVDQKMLDFPIFCIAYCPDRDRYVVGRSGGQNFSILKPDFTVERECLAAHTRYTTQGMECDRNYIYFVQHRSHCIMKYDWAGNFIEYIPLDEKGGEPENISLIDGRFYVGYNYWQKDAENNSVNKPRFFEVTLRPRDLEPKITKDMHEAVNARLQTLKGNGGAVENYMHYYSRHSLDCEKLYHVGPFGEHKILQGGGTDGKYLYLAFVRREENTDLDSVIVKLIPETGEIVKMSQPMELNHTNDITYNPKLGKLVVVHNYPNSDTVSFIDPETLERESTRTLERRIFCLSYNEKRDCYAAGRSGGQDIVIFDGDLNPIADYPAVNTTRTTQGMTCDDDYLYYAQFRQNCLMKYDWEGNFIEYLPMGNNPHEPENISFIGDRIYVACNSIVDKKLDVPAVWSAKIVENDSQY